ncbi:WXG100 family type VII secretion target [Streptomyces sp. BBFR2]|uniref:WXG100 family type VII secretion target n=1 Tax=Streptomyces sp. BBFR2 TaxID=3372854 RepID=UPI0037DA65E9
MVAGNQFTSTEHALQVAAKAIDNTHVSCQNIHSSVENSKIALAGTWTGNASGGFGDALATWQTQLKGLMDSLQAMGDQLGGTRNNFTTNESDNLGLTKHWVSQTNPR